VLQPCILELHMVTIERQTVVADMHMQRDTMAINYEDKAALMTGMVLSLRSRQEGAIHTLYLYSEMSNTILRTSSCGRRASAPTSQKSWTACTRWRLDILVQLCFDTYSRASQAGRRTRSN
jgi:hypothetical protein